ncbi:MAG: HlyC/CorC family transporter [Clostridia bacterium]|nr:HlyC/CorC family transporter [Clostridia bacterium]
MSSDIGRCFLLMIVSLIGYALSIHLSELVSVPGEYGTEEGHEGRRPIAMSPERTEEASVCFRMVLVLILGMTLYRASRILYAAFSVNTFWLKALIMIALFAGMLLLLTLSIVAARAIYARSPSPNAFMTGFSRTVTFVFTPLCALMHRGLALFHADEGDAGPTEEEILQIVDMGGEKGSIEENEREMIQNIFAFNNQTAEDVMTHRTDVTSIALDEKPEEILRTIMDTGLTRYPVYREDMDDIVGTLNARAYLLNLQRPQQKPLTDLIREAYFVPEHVQADVLFRDMQKKKIHMAIVIDEYGGMSGVVTMEDLPEQIVGNIYDEYDPQDETEITQLSPQLWRIAGSTSIEDLEEALGITLPEDREYDTLGGLIFSILGTIPPDGSHQEVDVENIHIRVEQLSDHRVEMALVRKRKENEK